MMVNVDYQVWKHYTLHSNTCKIIWGITSMLEHI